VVIGLAGFAGAAAGDLARRHGLSTVHRASLTALAMAILIIGLLPGSIGIAYTAATLFGVANIMLTGLYLVWGVRVFADRPAVGLGLPFLMLGLGQVAGAPVAGVVIGMVGHPAAFALFAGIAMATTLTRPTGSAT
jgi:predicted MFS family arabinose efflux permease